jgi:phosphatidylglycerophosphatase A
MMKLPRASTVVASVFGIGYFDVAPGTIMSAIAVPLAILIGIYGGGGMGILGASIITLVIGILACADHVRETGRDDPPECVIDELAGQWLACAFAMLTFNGRIPVDRISLPAFALAFGLFRLFDIWKPWPVSWADKNLSGGLGVMTDDTIAGLMAGALVAAARYFFHI